MKRIIKIAFTIVFCLIFATGCIFDRIDFSSNNNNSSSGNTNVTATACSLVRESTSSTSKATDSTDTTRKLSVNTTTNAIAEASKSAVTIYACYTVNNEEISMQSSAFIVGKDSSTHTYYISTSSSGIFYRYIASPSSTFSVATDTTVARTASFEVMTYNGQRISAEVVGYFDNLDVAIFKFQTEEEYNVVTYADSSEVNVGDSLYAIGTPCYGYSLYNSVIKGTVSGLNRMTNVLFEQTYNNTNYIGSVTTVPTFQFDAALNGGMEGGPIINSKGEVVGMSLYRYYSVESSFSTYVTNQSYESLAFGIAINDLRTVIDTIINSSNHTYSKPLIGVTISDVYQLQTDVSWLSTQQVYSGCYIIEDGISSGSAASAANMKENEVIYKVSFNSVEYMIENMSALNSFLYRLPAGSNSVAFYTYNSSGATTTYNLTLG